MTSTGRVQATSNPPTHWGEDWNRMVVYRAGLINHKGIEQPRKPLYEKPETLISRGAYTDRDLYWSKFWWGGVGLEHEDAVAAVNGDLKSLGTGCFGRFPGAAKDIAHLMWLDDQFVIDTDVKEVYDSPNGEPWIAIEGKKNSVTGAPVILKHGIDDLYREANAWGMERDELDEHLDTWIEGTKSGGRHIVLQQNPELRIDSTMHHKAEYRVDVLANNWRACYPTPGYGVLLDRPVKVAHKRLTELLIHLNKMLDPVGGKRMVRAEEEFKTIHQQTYRVGAHGTVLGVRDEALMDRWRHGVLNVVVVAQQLGNWNKRLFWAACRYAEGGWPQDTAIRDIIVVAQPWDAREERKALDSINSAYNNVERNKGVAR
ncbi:hypothetical protein PV350_23585 [Streptomyces sp. PA03-6a]|nr:hypothetical protein [Streptomyces sp. PA03-6a]